MRRIVSLLVPIAFVAAANAQDLELLQPQVSFSAWRVMSADGLQVEGQYHYAPGKHRNEIEMEGQKMTSILREDLDMMWNVMPDQRMYMELPIGSGQNSVPGNVGVEGSDVIESEALGSETVNGQNTTRYRVTVRTATGDTSSGLLWVTDDMIPMKMDMTSNGTQVVMELRDIEIGPQPDALFEVPDGYQRFSLGGLGGALGRGGFGGAGGAAAPDASDPEPTVLQEVAQEAREGAEEGAKQGIRENARRRIRGLFGN